MIYSPVEINVKVIEKPRSKVVRGVLLEGKELQSVIKLIDRNNLGGLKGKDALILMRLKEAYRDITPSKAKAQRK